MSALMCTYMHFKSILSKINELEKKCVIQYSFITFCFICLSNFKRINARKENWRQPRRSSVFLRLVLFPFPLYASFFYNVCCLASLFLGTLENPSFNDDFKQFGNSFKHCKDEVRAKRMKFSCLRREKFPNLKLLCTWQREWKIKVCPIH